MASKMSIDENDTTELLAYRNKGGSRRYRTYEPKRRDGRLLLERSEFDRTFDAALGIEPDPDDQDCIFLDGED